MGSINVPIASVPTVSYPALLAGDAAEEEKLFNAAKVEGVFHLDLGPDSTQWSWEAVDGMFDYAKEFFARPEADKERLPKDETISYSGYKKRGASVVDSKGNLDSMELLNISKIQSISKQCEAYQAASLITPAQAEHARLFALHAHNALLVLLNVLSKKLQLSPEENMADMHRIDVSSGDHLRVAEYREGDPQAPATDTTEEQLRLIPHTDFGSLTLLFSNNWGLQFQNPVSKEFEYIPPSPRMALINCGDSTYKFSGGVLHSCIHRVVANQRDKVKWTLGYFMRPEDDTPIRALKSPLIPVKEDEEVLTSKQWSLRREKAPKTESFEKNRKWHEDREKNKNWNVDAPLPT